MTTPLAFERLRVRRMPGIHDGGFELEGLSPGVNVVHGPNGSGKTTTAHAIEALLWPGSARGHAWLDAAARLGEGAWRVEVDGRQARWQRDGADAPAPLLPAAEARDRYRLSLHELLAADDAGFAEAIARESAGGYDLAAAARALDPRAGVSRATRELAALKEARARLDEARGSEAALRGEERRLADLDARLAGREGLAERLRQLELAIEHARAREAADAAERALAGFDPRMERVLGNEAEQLRTSARKLAEARAEEQAARAAEQRAEADLAACRLPETGLPPDLLPALKHERDALREQERSIAGCEQALRDAEARRARERAALGGAVNEGRIGELSVEGIDALAGFAKEAESLAAERAALEAQFAALQPQDASGPGQEALDRGVLFLRRWLQSGPGAEPRLRRLRALALAGAVGLILAGLALALVHPALAAAAALGVALLVLTLRVGPEPDARAVHQAEFAKLGLGGPASWTAEAVEARLAELEERLAAAHLAAERARQREEVSGRLAALKPREAASEARRAEIARRLGVDRAASNGSLVWLVERLGRWYDAQVEAEGAAAALEAARGQLADGLARAAARLAGHVDDEPLDVAALAGAIAELEGRQKEFEAASARLAAAQEKRASSAVAASELEADRAAQFERLGVSEEGAALVEGWCADRPRFQAARETHRLALAQRDALAARLRADAALDPTLLTEDGAVLSERLARSRDEVVELGRLHDDATRIRDRIKAAKRAHSVEEALARVVACEDALRAARAKDVRSAIADALVGFVQGATRDQHLPQVFHRARALFARVTHGRYRLDFDDGDAPSFRAYDTEIGIGHPLSELSSASRIQLLLAVRLAFVETQEQGVRLPLLLDETLGNSDDERAGAIMEALLELAAEGRQLFYFTAQPDEVGKWAALLESRSAPGTVIDLAAVRSIARQLDTTRLRALAPPRRVMPAPEEMTHAEYAAALAVPALDPFGTAESAHLWYLVEDPDELFSILGLGVERWGPLRVMVDHGAAMLVGPDRYARTAALARSLDCVLEARRVGRGRPVDRAVVVDSGVISPIFLDPVAELCQACDGDARRVLEALQSGAVSRFQARVRESFQDFLEENGYLDLRDPMGPEEVRARALAAVAEEIRSGALGADDVDRLLYRAGAGLATTTAG